MNATLNIACSLTFKRLRKAANNGMVGAVVQLCKSSFYSFYFHYANLIYS